ncbi:MAG: glycosyl hydrolase family 28 protein [Verrucomicrobiota bacterium]|jgi:polygalacturonase
MIKKHFQRWSRYGLILGLAALSFSARAQTPNAPANLTASAPSAFQISLSWTDNSANEDGFMVEQSLDGANFTQIAQVLANTTNYLNNGLFPGTNYFYRVRAYNSAGNSAYADVASAQTPTTPCPLSVVGWGDDGEGEIDIPSELTNGVVAIAAGYAVSLALKSDGTVVGWGDYDATPPEGLTGVTAIAACYFHGMALKSDGTVVGWGYNAYGETTPPTGLTGVVAIATGLFHSLALKSDGTVVAWGDNTHGQTNVPTGLTGVVAISAGFYHSLALKSDGTVVAWGAGQVNNPNGYDYGQSMVPVGLSNVVAIAAGCYHSLALKSDGTVVGWNSNYYSESTPPAGLTGVVAIAAGYYDNLTLKSDGTVVGWGNNSDGEATPPIGMTGMEAIAAGVFHSLALATSPGPPSAPSTTVVATNEVDLSWNEYSSGAEGFEIERAPDAGGMPGAWAQIATVGADVTSYSDSDTTVETNVATSTPYWYRVQAQNSCSDSPYALARVVYGILDDIWLSGTYTVQNPPTSSAWFTSSYGSLKAAPGAMTLTVGSSVLILTYFTPNSASPPVTLNVGDTLTAAISLTFNGLPTVASSSQGFRIGLFDFADGSNSPKRVTGDGFSSSSQGLNVAGYALFQKMYTTFSDATPMALRKRITLPDASLLGGSGDYTSLATGGSTNAFPFPGFANLTPYTLQFVLKRTSLTSMDITMTWSNQVTGAILTISTNDPAATNFSFDGIAFRPQNSAQAAVSNVFTEVKVGVTSVPVAPTIVTQPQSVDVSSGQNVTFTVVPNGTLPLSYQWYFNTNTPVANATNATLTLTNVQPANEGGYFVVITNSYGSVTSVVATLTGNTPPSITTQPVDLTVIPGQNATFTVGGYGSYPLSFQWYFNTNTPLPGATSPWLTLTNVQPGDAGSYSVVVSNATASVTSSYAILTVNTNPAAPVFILQPVSLTAREEDDAAAFTAAAVGTQPITYQWNFNGAPIPDATSNTLNLAGIKLSDAGDYTVIAANSIGSTTSSVAVLTVVPIIPPLPVINTNNIVNILDFGASTTKDNTTNIQNAINSAATTNGGCTVEIPAGTYLSGPLNLANNINLQIDTNAMLQMLPYGSWPGTSTFINGAGLHDVEISGSGTIDGQGAAWWAAYRANNNIGRPYFINFSGSCSNILIQNVTMQNPPTFHMMLKGNNVNLTIRSITINTPGNSPNTDGMDLASIHVLIQDCFISDGDDNIEIGGSGGPAADVTVTNCTFGTGHGVSLGSITSGDVSNLTVINCSFTGTDYGIRMKSDNDRGGLVQNLTYRNITMTNVGYPIVIYSYYNEYGTPNNISPQTAMNQPSTPVNPSTPIWRNILISNLTATATTGNNISGIIWGRPEMLVSNLTLCNVTIAAPTKTFDIYNAQDIRIIDSPLTAPNTTANTLRLYNAQVTVTNTTPGANLVTLGGLSVPPVNNVLAFYNTMAAIADTGMLGSNPITLGGSSLAFAQDSVAFSNNLNIVSASTLAMTSGNNSFSGAFLGSGPLALSLPAGSLLTLQGDSSGFSGALTVNDGTLLVDNTAGSGTGSGAVTVLSAATLGGTGVVGGSLTVNGTLAPGNSPGTLTVNNNLVVNDGAVLQYELGASSDLTVVNGNLTLGGALNITSVGGLGATNYTLFTYTGNLSGDATFGVTPPGYSFYLNTNTAGQVILIAYSNTPVAIRLAPSSQTAYLGSTVDLAARATGFPLPYYLWFANGTNLVGCSTNSRLELTNLQFSQIATYTVVVTNMLGAVTSSPAMLNVIPPVNERAVPAINLMGEAGSLLNVDYTSALSPAPNWSSLGSVSLTSTSQFYFDLTAPLPPQRFYRAWQTGTPAVLPSLNLNVITAITLTGNIGDSLQLNYINRFGPTDAWVTLDMVTLTNTSQLYFDFSMIGQPLRLYQIVNVATNSMASATHFLNGTITASRYLTACTKAGGFRLSFRTLQCPGHPHPALSP